MDTVQWHVRSQDEAPPITNAEAARPPIDKKDHYNISYFIPFEGRQFNFYSDDISPESSQYRFINYYGGAILALEQLESEGIELRVQIYDTQGDADITKKLLDSYENRQADLIVGPYKRDALRQAAVFGKERRIPVVSPWQASKRITNDNPYYIQLRPNLTDHYLHLLTHAKRNFDDEQIILVGRDNKSDKSRFKLFQKANETIAGSDDPDPIQEWIVDSDSLRYGKTVFDEVMLSDKATVFIIPNWSYNDEEFIYQCLRKLNVEKRDRMVYVYGMPILLDSDKMSFDYYRNLNMRVCRSKFVDLEAHDVRRFRRNYFDKFRSIPTAEAFSGYDVTLFLGRALHRYGKHFQYYLSEEEPELLHMSFDVIPMSKENDFSVDNGDRLDYFVNKHLDIVEFRNDRFRRALSN